MITGLDRSGFVPRVIWVPTADGYRAIDRATDPETWEAAVRADAPVVTQVDDGATPIHELGRSASSSSSQPTLVEAMLDAADLRRGLTVLEIGTGTGWTAGLLTQRLGPSRVVTVEVDPVVAATARAALVAAGLEPLVVESDGAAGYPSRAPYDRVLATCAVDSVPWSWIDQAQIGGLVVTPWGTAYHNGSLARLRRTGLHRAEGHFVDLTLAFMRLRAQRVRSCPWDGDGPGEPRLTECSLGSEEVYEMVAPPGAFAVGLVFHDCHKVVDEESLVVRLHDPESGSWARCTVTPGSTRQQVAEFGPRSLWEEACRARSWWIGRGRPIPSRFGLTLTPEGQQLWLDQPEQAL